MHTLPIKDGAMERIANGNRRMEQEGIDIICKECRKFEECIKEADSLGQVFDPNYDGEHCCNEFAAKTNADRIRAMSDEELAKHIWRKFGCPGGKDHVTCGYVGECKDCWLDWLQQPAEEN